MAGTGNGCQNGGGKEKKLESRNKENFHNWNFRYIIRYSMYLSKNLFNNSFLLRTFGIKYIVKFYKGIVWSWDVFAFLAQTLKVSEFY